MNDQLRDRSRTPVSPRDRERNNAKEGNECEDMKESCCKKRCGTKKQESLNALFWSHTGSSTKLVGVDDYVDSMVSVVGWQRRLLIMPVISE